MFSAVLGLKCARKSFFLFVFEMLIRFGSDDVTYDEHWIVLCERCMNGVIKITEMDSIQNLKED